MSRTPPRPPPRPRLDCGRAVIVRIPDAPEMHLEPGAVAILRHAGDGHVLTGVVTIGSALAAVGLVATRTAAGVEVDVANAGRKENAA